MMLSEPHKIKSIRRLHIKTFQERKVLLREAGYNTFRLHSDQVTYDMTSQGTSARSQEQESGVLLGDETYAGSRNFEKLLATTDKIFGHKFVCPTHNLIGAHKLVTTTMVNKGDMVCGNAEGPRLIVEYRNAIYKFIPAEKNTKYTGNVDLASLEQTLKSNKVQYVYINAYADGFRPVSLENLKEVISLTKKYGTYTVVNASQIVELATYIRKTETTYANKTLAEIVKEFVSISDVCVMDAAQDPRCNVGGMISSNNADLYEKYMNEVVVYEGLHTYGGMAGRTMEMFALGMNEMVQEPQAMWIQSQIEYFSSLLTKVPHIAGADGIYIKADEFLPNLKKHQAQAIAAALYIKAGIRAFMYGEFDGNTILPIQIPRLSLTNDQIWHIAGTINELYTERELINSFELVNQPTWQDEAIYTWNHPNLVRFDFKCEAHLITTIEYVGVTTKEERLQITKEVGYNTFLLPSKLVTIDFLTDSGTCAQTTRQWAIYTEGEESPASSKDYFELVATLQDITGYKYIIPTHQGRAAEHIMSQVLIKGGAVPGNMYFTTTKLHQEMAGGEFVDIIIDEAHNPLDKFLWKGNIDLKKLNAAIEKFGAKNIPYISFEFSVNLAGGQPVSMDNMREVYELCKAQGIPVMFDATRATENAYMIKKKDPRYTNVSIREILREMFSYGDGCTVSSKKDYLVNIGGFLAIREDEDFYKKSLDMLRKFEGTVTNGGMSAADMAVHAEGVKEMIDFNYISARVEQTQYLGNKLIEAGIPVVEPIGTHAVFLDAKRFLPHIDQDNYPAQALASALFIESGVRAMERGNVSKGRRPDGKNYRPALELVRLTIPRRAYTNSHMDTVAEAIINLWNKRETIKPLVFTYEPANLRFFQGKFEEVG